MNEPISITNITSDTPSLDKSEDVILTLEIPITLYGEHEGVTKDDVVRYTNYILSNWRDGRYPFSVEQISVGLFNVLRGAIRDSIEQHFMKMYMGRRNHMGIAKGGMDDNRAINRILASQNAIMAYLLAKDGVDMDWLEGKVVFNETTDQWETK